MKKVLKQIGAVLLSCLMILSSVTFSAFADTTSSGSAKTVIDFENATPGTYTTADDAKTAAKSLRGFSSNIFSNGNVSIESDGSHGNVLKISGSKALINNTNATFTTYANPTINNDGTVQSFSAVTSGKHILNFDMYIPYIDGSFALQIWPYTSGGVSFDTNVKLISGRFPKGYSANADRIENTDLGWFNINFVSDLDTGKYTAEIKAKTSNKTWTVAETSYSKFQDVKAAGINHYQIGAYVYKNYYVAYDNIETYSLTKEDIYLNAASLSVNNNRIGKIMTVTAGYEDSCTEAKLYFDDNEISLSNKTARIPLLEDVNAGDHTLKLELTYPDLNAPIVKTLDIKVYEKNEPADSILIDFENATPGTYSSAADATAAAKSLQGFRGGIFTGGGDVSIVSDASKGNMLKISANTSDIAVSAGCFFAYANPNTKSNAKSGKHVISYDINIPEVDSEFYMQVWPYGDQNHVANTKDFNCVDLVSAGKIAGTNEDIISGWYNVTFVSDLDKKEYSAVIANASGEKWNIPVTKYIRAWDGGIYDYRIGTSIKTGFSVSYDNIKTGSLESDLLHSVAYVKSSVSYPTDGIIANDADSVKLNVSKEYATLTSGAVTLSVNDEAAMPVDATYASKTITVPLPDVKEGDKITIKVSGDAELANGTTVDEPITVELIAGDENGSGIAIANNKASAVLNINCAEEKSAIGYIAVYDNGELIALHPTDVAVASGTNIYALEEITLPANYTNIKAFVFDGVTPLVKAVEYIK